MRCSLPRWRKEIPHHPTRGLWTMFVCFGPKATKKSRKGSDTEKIGDVIGHRAEGRTNGRARGRWWLARPARRIKGRKPMSYCLPTKSPKNIKSPHPVVANGPIKRANCQLHTQSDQNLWPNPDLLFNNFSQHPHSQ